jgi:hypothetical protein
MDILFRKRPRYRALLVAHIAAAVSLVGTDLVLIVLALGRDYPAALLVAQWLVEPLAVAALATGILAAVTGPYGLFRFWWTSIKLAITAALNVAVFLVLTPALERAASVPADAVQPITLLLAPLIAVGLLVVNITLAVFKPAARLPRGTGRAALQEGFRT